jgi:sarcosine oxidase/sarcosine oxidase subunit beta
MSADPSPTAGHAPGHVVVVGAGAMGLCTAWGLVRRGLRVTVIDQGPIPNPVSSSFDQHRIIRHAYGAMRGYAALMPSAFAAWRLLWADLGEDHLVAAPATYCLRMASDWYADVSHDLTAMGIPFADVPLDEVPRRLPMVATQDLFRVVETQGAGLLLADRIVGALAAWLRAQGVVLMPRTRALSVDPVRGTVRTDAGEVSGDAVAVTAGAWVHRLLPGLPGAPVPSAQTVAYLEPPADLAEAWATAPLLLNRLPVASGGVYVLPPRRGTGLKIGDYDHPRIGDPDEPRVPRPELVERLMEAGRRALAGFDRYRLVEAKSCFYAVTDDGAFVLRRLDARGWVLSACTGHGFKLAALMGLGFADGLAGRQDADDLATWAAGRAIPLERAHEAAAAVA